MNKDRQKEIIADLCTGLHEKLKQDIDRIPDNWDGLELRQWVADTFTACFVVKMRASRKRAYKNTCLINNL